MMPTRPMTIGVLMALFAATAIGAEVSLTARPAAVRDVNRVKITFAVSAPTDVEVAILDAQGKVARSLAAGVLGAKNPPPEPLKPGLAQTLEWDGKGDWNLPVGSGPLKVRVRAGMGVKFGRMVGDSPYNFFSMQCRGLAVDPGSGDLYCLTNGFGGGPEEQRVLPCLRVYDRTGKYLREIMPYPSTIDAKSREVYGSLSVPGMESPAPFPHLSIWPLFYPMISRHQGGWCWDWPSSVSFKLMGIHPVEGGTLLLLDEYLGSVWRVRMSDGGAGTPFDEALVDAAQKPDSAPVGPVTGAVSPDGKMMYFAGYCSAAPRGQKVHPKWPEGRVYLKQSPQGKLRPFADIDRPKDWPPARECWRTAANGGQTVHGIAVDKEGNVLVCDTAGGRVRVFSPEGKETGAIDAPGAYLCVSNPKTDALYVVTRAKLAPYELRNQKLGVDALVKYEGSAPGAKPVAALALKGVVHDLFLAGDFSRAEPQLWLSGCLRVESLLRIEERGGRLEVAEDLADRGKTAAGFAARIDVDPEADLVYISDGFGHNRRYSGISGEYAGKLGDAGLPEAISGAELCVRRDGMIYTAGAAGGQNFSGPWRRLNRDLSPAPLGDGRKEFSLYGSKMGACWFGTQGSCVTPDGRLYWNGMWGGRINAIFELSPDGSPGRHARLHDIFARGKPEVGELGGHIKAGFKGALVGPVPDQSGGVEIDQKGCIYVGMRVLARDDTLPEELAKVNEGKLGGRFFRHGVAGVVGSVVKFGPEGGGGLPDPEKYKAGTTLDIKTPTGQFSMTMPSKVGPGLVVDGCGLGRADHTGGEGKGLYLEGALKTYPLLAPFSAPCACHTPRFEVDDYGRLYIPNALTCSVQVVDNEGNEILRFGGYGNSDSRGPGSEVAKPGIPLACPRAVKASLKYVYVADLANRRVVRVDPTWKAEETCEVK